MLLGDGRPEGLLTAVARDRPQRQTALQPLSLGERRRRRFRRCLGSLIGFLLLSLPAFAAAANPQPSSSAGVVAAAPPGPSAQPAIPEASPEVLQVVALVQAAAAAVRLQGEAVFPEFRRRGSPWFQGDRYVFVLTPDGRSVVYPPDVRGEGLNYREFQDLGGKPFGRQFIAVAESPTGRGWVHYQWRRPVQGDRRPVWKATYLETVKAPSGRTYLVLSGIYEPPMNRVFVKAAVDGAAELLSREGRSAFPALRDRLGPHFYQDTYVFVTNSQGELLLNPGFPALEGRNLTALPDQADRARAQAALKSVLADGSSWTRYSWPRPDGSGLRESKTTYLRKVVAPGGEVLIVGSGLYTLP